MTRETETNEYEDLELELAQRYQARDKKVAKATMVVDGASVKLLHRLSVKRNTGRDL